MIADDPQWPCRKRGRSGRLAGRDRRAGLIRKESLQIAPRPEQLPDRRRPAAAVAVHLRLRRLARPAPRARRRGRRAAVARGRQLPGLVPQLALLRRALRPPPPGGRGRPGVRPAQRRRRAGGRFHRPARPRRDGADPDPRRRQRPEHRRPRARTTSRACGPTGCEQEAASAGHAWWTGQGRAAWSSPSRASGSTPS